MVKVIQIGFHKCGTRSMHTFFKKNNCRSVHWLKGVIGRQLFLNITMGRPPFEGHENYIFYSDLMGPTGLPIIEGHFFYREMYMAYPDSLFILNTRDEDNWIRSRQQHPELINRFKRQFRVSTSCEVEQLWRAQWRAHHKSVIEFFSDKSRQLLVFNIEQQGGAELAAFVADYYELDSAKWGHVGKASV